MKKVLIIDDEIKLRHLMSRMIDLEGFEVLEVDDCASAIKKLEQNEIDVVLCDVKLPDGNGVEFLKKIKEIRPMAEVILLTAYGNIPDSVQAIKNGAFDYITKGDDNNKILPLLLRAMQKVDISRREHQLELKINSLYSFDQILGRSKVIQQAIELAKLVAVTDTTVLLTGETGTGKEVFAQAIHYGSNRRKQKFVAINCSAFSRDLLESEMFGHKAGSFTGAVKEHKGLFEEANHGTIFLDEIGEMAPDLQAKILRVIEQGEYNKVGESKTSKTNVRIIAATNRDLPGEIANGNFRRDLYYRLSVFQINLPPLNERIQDIELLADYFLKKFAGKTNKKISAISPECLDALKLHVWNGNIRELKNVIERCVILCTGDKLITQNLPLEMQQEDNRILAGKQLSGFDLASSEKIHIQKVLNYTNGNKTETAKLLNIALTTLYRKLEEYRIS